jgi:hypothetical protein
MTFSYYVLATLAVGPCVQDRTAAFARVTAGWTMVHPFNHFSWPRMRCRYEVDMDKGGVAVGLATISVVGAALLFSAEHVRSGAVNFIERHLSISPDGGDGSIEILGL